MCGINCWPKWECVSGKGDGCGTFNLAKLDFGHVVALYGMKKRCTISVQRFIYVFAISRNLLDKCETIIIAWHIAV